MRIGLRIFVLKAFRESNVEIPYPQIDVHFLDLQWIKKMLNERRAELEELRASGTERQLTSPKAKQRIRAKAMGRGNGGGWIACGASGSGAPEWSR